MSGAGGAPSETQNFIPPDTLPPEVPLYKQSWVIVLLLIFVAPVGAVLMWMYTHWRRAFKIGAMFWLIYWLGLCVGATNGNRGAATPVAAPGVAISEEVKAEASALLAEAAAKQQAGELVLHSSTEVPFLPAADG